LRLMAQREPRRRLKTIATLILIISALLLIRTPSLAGQFKVTRVHDGETIRAEGYGIEIVVRLAGIEIPVAAQQNHPPLALEAKSYLADMVLNKVIDIKGHGVDDMNRVLGVLMIQQVNVNLEMIKAGYAIVYRERSSPSPLPPPLREGRRGRKTIPQRDLGHRCRQKSQEIPFFEINSIIRGSTLWNGWNITF
jgi:micrococcal nuclease